MRGVLAALALTGCTALADFPEDRLAETTDALCGNGIDDDADGLTDCQDWTCLDREVCCTLPSVVLDDAFSSEACGAAPDEVRWQAWGTPYPHLCDGALVIGKDELCYPVGVISRDSARLAPSLRVEASVTGVPEEAAYVAVGLAVSPLVLDGVEPCSIADPFPALFAVVAVPDPDGVRFVASVENRDVADVVVPGADHRVQLRVEDDRTVSFVVDDEVFARTTDAVPADPPIDTRVFVRGLGSAARVDDLRVFAGTQCDLPGAWFPAATIAPLDPPPGTSTWDGFARGFPNARHDGDSVRIAYVGCRERGPMCDSFSFAIGEAVAERGGAPLRPAEAMFRAYDIGDHFAVDFQIADTGDEGYWGDDFQPREHLFRIDLAGGVPAGTAQPILTGTPGSWDARVTAPQVMQVSQYQRLLWYTAIGEDRARIAVAKSEPDGTFVREELPALDPGEDEEYAQRGVQQPAVIYDAARGLYRMWFTATGAFGTTSIGYAVSTDGLRWHLYPDNPVVSSPELGISTIGSPTVVDDGGRLRMWIHGSLSGDARITIFELENLGVRFAAP